MSGIGAGLALRILLPAVLVSGVLAGCTRRIGFGEATIAWAPCVAGDFVANLSELAGEYDLALYATSGFRAGRAATGDLALHAQSNDLMAVPDVDGSPMIGASMPLYGSARVDLDRVGATAAGELTSADPEAPGVGLYALKSDGPGPAPELTMRWGVEANRRSQIRFDGTYMAVAVREWGRSAIAGEWASGDLEGEKASGRFCATRKTGS